MRTKNQIPFTVVLSLTYRKNFALYTTILDISAIQNHKFAYRKMYTNVHSAMSAGGTKPSMATSTVSKLDEMHNGKKRLKPKNLDK